MAFTCSGTTGRTRLLVGGQVLVDFVIPQTEYRVVRPTGSQLRFDVETGGTRTIYLRKASRPEARSGSQLLAGGRFIRDVSRSWRGGDR